MLASLCPVEEVLAAAEEADWLAVREADDDAPVLLA